MATRLAARLARGFASAALELRTVGTVLDEDNIATVLVNYLAHEFPTVPRDQLAAAANLGIVPTANGVGIEFNAVATKLVRVLPFFPVAQR